MPKNTKPELKPGEKFNRLTVLKFSHSDKRWCKSGSISSNEVWAQRN